MSFLSCCLGNQPVCSEHNCWEMEGEELGWDGDSGQCHRGSWTEHKLGNLNGQIPTGRLISLTLKLLTPKIDNINTDPMSFEKALNEARELRGLVQCSLHHKRSILAFQLVNSMHPRVWLPGFESWLHHSLAGSLWANNWTSMYLFFLVCKMGILTEHTLKAFENSDAVYRYWLLFLIVNIVTNYI